MSRIVATSFASVYPHYVTTVERTGRTEDELARSKSTDRVLRS